MLLSAPVMRQSPYRGARGTARRDEPSVAARPSRATARFHEGKDDRPPPAHLWPAPAGAAIPRARYPDHLGRQQPGYGSSRAAAGSAPAYRPAEYHRQSSTSPPALTGSAATSWPTRTKAGGRRREGLRSGKPFPDGPARTGTPPEARARRWCCRSTTPAAMGPLALAEGRGPGSAAPRAGPA